MPKQFLGFGLGLRSQHYQSVLDTAPKVDWFEIISENYMVAGGKPRYYLEQIRANYPIVMHGVSMSIGSTDPVNVAYLKQLKRLSEQIQPEWMSDHLCFTTVGGINSHDLLPMPYTEESLLHLKQRIQQVQEYLGREMVFENVSSYITYQHDEMQEWEFLAQLAQQSGCKFLLDINNIYVSARNHNFDPMDYLDAINPQWVQQIHLAGHSDFGTHVIDTHDHPVPDPVWQLYAAYIGKCGPVSTMIERDDNIPELSVLVSELEQARIIGAKTWQLPQEATHA